MTFSSKFLLGFLLLLTSQISTAQDLLYKQNGSTMNVKIIEIGIDQIIYTDGGTKELSIKKSEIQKILYQNGREEMVTATPDNPSREIATKQPVQKTELKKPVKSEKQAATFDQPKSAYIGINIGGAVPLGDLGDNKSTNPSSQFMLTGFNFNLEGAVYLGKYFAIGGKFLSNTYVRDDEILITNAVNTNQNDGYSTTVTAETEPSQFSAGLLGVKLCLPIRRFSAELGFFGGYAGAKLGALKSTQTINNTEALADPNNNQFVISQPKLSSSGLGGAIDLTLKLDITKRLYLGTQLEFVSHRTNFPSNYNIDYYSTYKGTYSNDTFPTKNFTWSSCNISLSFGYVFRKHN